jgi:hypothetical protein
MTQPGGRRFSGNFARKTKNPFFTRPFGPKIEGQRGPQDYYYHDTVIE